MRFHGLLPNLLSFGAALLGELLEGHGWFEVKIPDATK